METQDDCWEEVLTCDWLHEEAAAVSSVCAHIALMRACIYLHSIRAKLRPSIT